jgi:hypothetical protein
MSRSKGTWLWDTYYRHPRLGWQKGCVIARSCADARAKAIAGAPPRPWRFWKAARSVRVGE